MITTECRGHKIQTVGSKGYYIDNYEIAFIGLGVFVNIDGEFIRTNHEEMLWNERPCRRCKKYPTTEGHDYCIRNLPDVDFACCGHGVNIPYVKFKNGLIIRGWAQIEKDDKDEQKYLLL